MAKLLSDSDSDVDFSINKDYAETYEKWRSKEELQKLKDRYGESADVQDAQSTSSSSEESEDEEATQITPNFEKEFFKTLSLLKSKDPRIYDKNVTFFENETDQRSEEKATSTPSQPKKQPVSGPMYLRDYERKVIVEKQGILSDEEDYESDRKRPVSPTYLEEQQKLKESFKEFMEDSDDDANDLLTEKKKTKEQQEAEEEEYHLWLKGETEKLTKDKALESDLKPLHDYWNNPALDTSEAFLRDYVLHKHIVKEDDGDRIPSYEEIVDDAEGLSEDEQTLEKQAHFEHKYNFRFEEPDPEFIKRFPRTIKESLRRKNDARKLKREELRKRKEEEKVQKQEELKRLKALKRKEIMEKIEHIKEITGNSKIGFDSIDLSCDFDPEKYDEQMNKLFDEEYYAQDEGDQKPVFPSDDEIGSDIDQWDDNGEYNEGDVEMQDEEAYDQEWHCEDPEFNMDADYDPSQEQSNEPTTSKGRKRKKSKFAQALSQNREKIMKEKKSLIEAFDEYYKLDYCDMIGDTPIRFRYRNVEPNDFGLTTEEILLARDKELNQWCSLKKTCQYRSKEEELYDIQAFKKKANNAALKQKVLKSLYQETPEGESEPPAKKRKRRRKKKNVLDVPETVEEISNPHSSSKGVQMKMEESKQSVPVSPEKAKQPDVMQNGGSSAKKNTNEQNQMKKKDTIKKKKKQGNFRHDRNIDMSKLSKPEVSCLGTSADRLKAFGINPKKVRNKILYAKKQN